jgi:cytochrome P450
MQVSTTSAKIGSKARRWLLRVLVKLSGDGASDPSSLLSRFPEQALMPLRRNGLDPVAELSQLREHEPVSRLKMPLGLRGWLVTGYEESRAVLAADPATFSNDFGNMIGTTRALAARAPRIAQIIDEALEETALAADADGVVDLQQHFSLPIPSRTIMELLGIVDADRDEFQRLSTARFDMTGGATGSLDLIAESIGYLEEIVARQRVDGGDGLIASVLAEYGDEVGDVELAGLMDGVLTGGLETTVSMLSLGAVALLQHPEMSKRLREQDDYAEAFVEEALRHLTVVQVGFPRFACQDVTVGGRSMIAGDVVVCSLVAANRDPRHGGSTMDTVDPDRPQQGHLAFGHGLHRCVGAELARLELRMAYPALARRFPDLHLAVPADELPYRKLSLIHGLERLPVLLEQR